MNMPVRNVGLRSSNRAWARGGVTLLEVLISMFVLTIGLLSIAALIPVATFQVSRSQINDRKAIVGQEAWREVKAREFLRPELWVTSTGTIANMYVWGDLYYTGSLTSKPTSFKPVAIDPLMVAAPTRFSWSSPTVPNFASSGPVVMSRYSLATLGATNWAAASQICISQDDMIFDLPANQPDAPPVGGFTTGASGPSKRRSEGRYSWMVTLSPYYGDTVTTDSRQLAIMSLVVFKDRAFNLNPTTNYVLDSTGTTVARPATERPMKVAFNGTTLAGGDIQLIDSGSPKPGAANLNVNVGDWIMLGFGATNNLPNAKQQSYVRWYRIVAAPPAFEINNTTPWRRNITVAGPDMNVGTEINYTPAASGSPPTAASNAMAYIYEGAVGVYERMVHLEGPSSWMPPNVSGNTY